MRRARIAHVITRLELGGAQQNTLYCCEHHDRSRFEVMLVAGRGGILDDRARGIDDADVVLTDALKHPIAPASDARALAELVRLFRERRPDLVHTHSSKAGILGRLAARIARVPRIVHTVHGWSFNDTQALPRREGYVQLERMAARWTDRLIAVSAKNRDDGLDRGIGDPEQYAVLHSGIDLDAWRSPETPRETVRRALGYDDGQFVVGSVACLKPQKAPLDLVAAAAYAHARDPRLRFFVAGDGELRPAVEAEIARRGLGDVVRLLGWRDDVVDLLHASDAFLLTSLYEGLPRAVLQAMAAGRPVVATAVDGTPEVVLDGRTGLLVPPGRPEAAGRAVIRLAADPALAGDLAVSAARFLDGSFDIRQMVNDLDALYAELVA